MKKSPKMAPVLPIESLPVRLHKVMMLMLTADLESEAGRPAVGGDEHLYSTGSPRE